MLDAVHEVKHDTSVEWTASLDPVDPPLSLPGQRGQWVQPAQGRVLLAAPATSRRRARRARRRAPWRRSAQCGSPPCDPVARRRGSALSRLCQPCRLTRPLPHPAFGHVIREAEFACAATRHGRALTAVDLWVQILRMTPKGLDVVKVCRDLTIKRGSDRLADRANATRTASTPISNDWRFFCSTSDFARLIPLPDPRPCRIAAQNSRDLACDTGAPRQPIKFDKDLEH